VLSGRGLCDELVTRPEESYRLWYVVVCDLETSRMRRPWPALGRSATKTNKQLLSLHKTEKVCYLGVTTLCRNSSVWSLSPAPSVTTKDLFKLVDTTFRLEVADLTLRIRTHLLGLTMHWALNYVSNLPPELRIQRATRIQIKRHQALQSQQELK
jgi:hypothetical protein